MIYQIDNKKIQVSIEDMDEHHMYIGVMDLEELKQTYHLFCISPQFVERCEVSSLFEQNEMIPHKNYYFGIINLINSKSIFMKKDTFAFFIFKNCFLIVVLDDEDHHIEELLLTSDDVLGEDVSLTHVVYYFLSELISRDYNYIEDLQNEIEELENHDSKEESIHFTRQLKQKSKELLLLINYYNNLVTVGEELQMNHHQIFVEDDMRYFEIFTRRIERLSKNAQMLKELLYQASEAHQAKLDYHMNKTMQLFTVLTSIFMPLTLITGWYGMNFYYMPELKNPYGYLGVIILSISVITVSIFWFKKKKFF